LFMICLIGAAVGYALAGALVLPDLISSGPDDQPPGQPGQAVSTTAPAAPSVLGRYANWALTFAGTCALIAVCLPFLVTVGRLRWRRIWGVARLSAKEAIRRKVLYVFALMLLLFLFLNWFVPAKPE